MDEATRSFGPAAKLAVAENGVGKANLFPLIKYTKRLFISLPPITKLDSHSKGGRLGMTSKKDPTFCSR